MTFRAVILGFALGLLISALTYFNDQILRGTPLIGNFLPIGVFGALMLLLLAVNPLLRVLGRRWPMTAGELAVVTALGLAACGWPGTGLLREFTTVLAMPSHLSKSQPAWLATEVMAYLPGGPPRIVEGQVRDWPALVRRLAAARQSAGPDRALWNVLPEDARDAIRRSAASGLVGDEDQRTMLKALNGVVANQALYASLAEADLPERARTILAKRADLGRRIEETTRRRERLLVERRARRAARAEGSPTGVAPQDPSAVDENLARLDSDILRLSRVLASLDQRVGTKNQTGRLEEETNRAVLDEWLAGVLLPRPDGEGALVAGGEADPFAVDTLQMGWDGGAPLSLADLPWDTWWPTLRLWGGVALLLGLASVCLVLIVHPQWSQRELLAYPMALFVQEVTRTGPGASLPLVLRSRLFWYGFGALVLVHLVNGLNAWLPQVQFLRIPLNLDFGAARELFPSATKIEQSWSIFWPRFYLSIAAFAFFLSSEVSFSLGVCGVAWVAVGGLLISHGVSFGGGYVAGDQFCLLLFGAYVGLVLVMLYFGRRYYWNVAAGALGLPRRRDTPSYAVWAARGFAACLAVSVCLLVQGGLDWLFSLLVIGIVLLVFVVVARINVETGAVFIQTWWLPVGVLPAIFGAQAISPQALLMIGLASAVLVGGPRDTLMPYLANGLRMGEEAGGVAVRRLAPALAAMVVVGFAIALGATFYLQYNHGVDMTSVWHPQPVTFNSTSAHISDLSAHGTLAQATATKGLGALAALKPDGERMAWMAAGAGLVVACTLARLRVSWWFLHPAMFIFWGTYPGGLMAASYLLGWAVKTAVLRLGGARAYAAAKPLMVGVIAGELVAGLGWMLTGAIYWAATDHAPVVYRLLPPG